MGRTLWEMRSQELRAVISGLFENLQSGSRAAPGIAASTPQSRRRYYDMRSWKTSTAAAEYCGEPARRHKKEK